MTGYPSIDKPWLKYYSEEAVNAKLPECTVYEYLWENNKDYLDNVALNYYDRKITYGEMFDNIEKATKSYQALGLKEGDIVTIFAVTIPETIYSFYGLNRLGVICNMVDPRTSPEGILYAEIGHIANYEPKMSTKQGYPWTFGRDCFCICPKHLETAWNARKTEVFWIF